MNLEEQILDFASKYRTVYDLDVTTSWGIEKDVWSGKPVDRRCRNFWDNVHQMIQDAPLEVALTSNCKYIREYRKWYENTRTKDQ